MGRVAPKIVLSSRQEDILQKQVRAHQTGQQASIRMQIILEAAKGSPNIEVAELLRVDEQRVRRWRTRWVARSKQLEEAEQQNATDGDLTALIVKRVCQTNIEAGRHRNSAPNR